jgi:ergothioneine biosynthesis protein EgtB
MFCSVRRASLRLCEPLTPEDMMVQSCPEASPAKWHIAHTAWFFESFVLREFLPNYQLFNPDFPWLFNSYYQTFAEFPDKRLRASFSRPGLDEILAYRRHVDEGIKRLLSGESAAPPPEALRRIVLGLNHEEQHQELLLTDIKHALYTNPLQPPYIAGTPLNPTHPAPMQYFSYPGGLVEIGQNDPATSGSDTTDPANFGFDNEFPRHRVWLEPFRLASRLVTCGEYADFIADNGYSRPELWLSAGWQAVKDNNWTAPLYWRRHQDASQTGRWTIGSLRGRRTLAEAASTPVTHISYFEADAYAHWAGKRLATEAEWEHVASTLPIAGNFLESGQFEPAAAQPANHPAQLFGDCWEWTASAYLGYPGFQPLDGTLGEYNGKFMSGQMILRGGSCVTPERHIRAAYRNFFSPETRWQFSGIRLAE